MNVQRFQDSIRITPDANETLSPLALKTIEHTRIMHAISPDKIRRNGKWQYMYSLQDAETMTVALQSLGTWEREQTVKRVLLNFFDLLKTISESGFLRDTYVMTDLDLVFLSNSTGEGRFILFPVDGYRSETYAIKWLEQTVQFLLLLVDKCEDDSLNVVLQKIQDSNIDDGVERGTKRFRYKELLDDLSEIVRDDGFRSQITQRIGSTEVELRYDGDYGKIAFFVRKDEFVVGADVTADGVITGNPAVSRKHCLIKKRNDYWVVSDLGSTNATYLDGRRIAEHEEALLRNGMELRLADMPFHVTVEHSKGGTII